ncbi:MAG TPA: condensation domain-containing protein [bacterium]|nr:condensation domain-containing protein [bacterium]
MSGRDSKRPESWSSDRRKLAAELLRRRGLGKKAPDPAAPAAPALDEGPAPLTFNQEGLWAIDRMHPGRADFSVPGALRLRGPLDADLLERALAIIVRRQDVLRSTFREIEGVPRQVVTPAGDWRLPREDLAGRPPGEREAEALAALTREARRPFDLAEGPLFRALLLRLADDDHVLSVNFHHAVADGWSMGVFMDELTALCDGAPEQSLPALPVSFAAFAREERAAMSGEKPDRALRYWQKHLEAPLPLLRLPTDRPRPETQSFRGRHVALDLPADVAAAVRKVAREEGASPYMILLAAWNVLMHGLSGQRDLLVGTTFANRTRADVDRLIGFFANTMPVRTSLEGRPTFREIVARVKDGVLGAYDHQELPFAKLLQHVAVERSSGRNPVFQVVFDVLTLDRNPAIFGYGMASRVKESRRVGTAEAHPMDVEGAVARFDLAVFLWDTPSGFSGTVEYSTDLFNEATVTGFTAEFTSLVRRVTADPGMALANAVGRRSGAPASADGAPRGFRGAVRRPILLKEGA